MSYKKQKISTLLIVFAVFISTAQIQKLNKFYEYNPTLEHKVDVIFNSLSDTEKVAQMIITSAGELGKPEKIVYKLAQENKIGGVVFLKGTSENHKKMIDSLNANSEETLEIKVEVLSTGDYSNVAEVVAVDQDDTDSDPEDDNEDEDDTDTITLEVKDDGDNGLDNSSEIGDYIWLDANGNGLQENTEPGIEGITVNLYQSNNINTIFKTIESDKDGYFCFTELSSGNYFVEFIIPDGYVVTKPKAGVNIFSEDKENIYRIRT